MGESRYEEHIGYPKNTLIWDFPVHISVVNKLACPRCFVTAVQLDQDNHDAKDTFPKVEVQGYYDKWVTREDLCRSSNTVGSRPHQRNEVKLSR